MHSCDLQVSNITIPCCQTGDLPGDSHKCQLVVNTLNAFPFLSDQKNVNHQAHHVIEYGFAAKPVHLYPRNFLQASSGGSYMDFPEGNGV